MGVGEGGWLCWCCTARRASLKKEERVRGMRKVLFKAGERVGVRSETETQHKKRKEKGAANRPNSKIRIRPIPFPSTLFRYVLFHLLTLQ